MSPRRDAIFCSLIGLLLCCAVSCASTKPDPRAEWLQRTLIEDNAVWLQQRPELVGEKFVKMGSDPYSYLRGTLPQFLRDQHDLPTRFGSADKQEILLVGDPHIENIGTYRSASGEMLVDYNDFDASTWGSWVYDVRRLASSFFVLGAVLEGELEGERFGDRFAMKSVEGYYDAIIEARGGGSPLRIRRENAGTILDDLLRRAERDGDAREHLEVYTLVRDERRQMIFGTIEPRACGVYQNTTEPVSDDIAAIITGGLEAYRQTLVAPAPSASFFVIKGMSRRYGPGVSSYPALRFYVLVEGPSEAIEDDVLLEVKELPRTQHQPPAPLSYTHDAERAVLHQRALQESDANDALLGFFEGGARSFRVRALNRYQRGLNTSRIIKKLAKSKWTVKDIDALATIAGALLARAHAGATMRNGGSALETLARALEGAREPWLDEHRTFLGSYGPQIMADYDRLRAILEQRGPSLGSSADSK